MFHNKYIYPEMIDDIRLTVSVQYLTLLVSPSFIYVERPSMIRMFDVTASKSLCFPLQCLLYVNIPYETDAEWFANVWDSTVIHFHYMFRYTIGIEYSSWILDFQFIYCNEILQHVRSSDVFLALRMLMFSYMEAIPSFWQFRV